MLADAAKVLLEDWRVDDDRCGATMNRYQLVVAPSDCCERTGTLLTTGVVAVPKMMIHSTDLPPHQRVYFYGSANSCCPERTGDTRCTGTERFDTFAYAFRTLRIPRFRYKICTDRDLPSVTIGNGTQILFLVYSNKWKVNQNSFNYHVEHTGRNGRPTLFDIAEAGKGGYHPPRAFQR